MKKKVRDLSEGDIVQTEIGERTVKKSRETGGLFCL